MYEFFVYDYLDRGVVSGPPQRVCVAYCSSPQVTDSALLERLKGHFSAGIPPDTILLVGAAGKVEMLKMHEHLLSSPLLMAGLPAMTRYIGTPALNALWIENDGTIGSIGAAAERFAKVPFLQQLVHEGLMRIFRDRRGMLDSLGRYHYVKPSGKHSDKFIRTANVLMRGAEVSFIAFSLLPHLLQKRTTHIYTDTAAINAVAYALAALRQQLDPGFQMPTIDSFSSYGGLSNFKFEATMESLILISASTSHDLESELIRQHKIPQEQIVTIYYLGRRQPESKVLCDLTKEAKRNPEGFEPIVSFSHEDCPLCRQGLLAVRIAGDQFLPENPKVISETLEKKNAPGWLNRFMKDFVGKGVISCHHPDRALTPGREHELYIDLAPVLADGVLGKAAKDEPVEKTEFVKRLEYLISQGVPASLGRIIHLDDLASAELASRILEWFIAAHKSPVPVVAASEVMSKMPEHVMDEGTTLVVASSIVTGRSLLAISQSLRQIQRNNSVQYLVGVSRTASQQRIDEVRSNVQYGPYGGRDHRFDAVRIIFVPDKQPSPWSRERAFLISLKDKLRGEPKYLTAVDERLVELDSGGRDGLQRHLFWPSVSGKPLELRPNFAFWEFPYTKSTQAEVYFSMAAVLHEFRIAHSKSSDGTQAAHHRVILSPRNFDRFNDGVIQASILRAARDWEIDYSIDREASADMKRILEWTLQNRNGQHGEAALEFLLALAQRTLRLAKDDETDLVELLKSTKGCDRIALFTYALIH